MQIKENIGLAQYTTFKVGGQARFFCSIKSEQDLIEAVKFAQQNKLSILVIGKGSNLLIPDEGYLGLVIHSEIFGKEFEEAGGKIVAKVGSGEDWIDFVKDTVDRGLYGLEALAGIPGSIGAAPVQNVGAYGYDVSSTIILVRALDTQTMQFVELPNAECRFSYRHSRFKEEKGRFIVSSVSFSLAKEGKVSIQYSDLKKYFANRGPEEEPSLKEVHRAVMEIRMNKLPDWHMWGTAGSFFKNPVISQEKFDELRVSFPKLPGFPEPDGRIKVPLGWVLDKICNAKGYYVGNVGTYEKQALVLVTKPGATAKEIIDFSRSLMDMVMDKTGIKVDAEVEWAVA